MPVIAFPDEAYLAPIFFGNLKHSSSTMTGLVRKERSSTTRQIIRAANMISAVRMTSVVKRSPPKAALSYSGYGEALASASIFCAADSNGNGAHTHSSDDRQRCARARVFVCVCVCVCAVSIAPHTQPIAALRRRPPLHAQSKLSPGSPP